MVSSQFHYTKRNRFVPFLLAEILNFKVQHTVSVWEVLVSKYNIEAI